MNADQNNRLDSYRAGLALLGNTTETNAIVGFAAKCVTFGNKVEAIAELITRQAEAGPGKRAERDQVFAEMKDSALALAGVVLSYADEKGMIDLATTVRVVRSDFYGRLGERVRLAQRILTAAESVSEGLAALGVTAAGLAEMQAKIDQAEAAMTLPRATIAARKAATEQLALAFRETDAFLDRQLLPLLLPLKKTKPEFYARVLATLQVIDRPGSRSVETKSVEKGGDASGVAPAASVKAAA